MASKLKRNNMSDNTLEWEDWEDLVMKIRKWDREEHNWYSLGLVDTKNLKTKPDFIVSLMKEYELKKKDKS